MNAPQSRSSLPGKFFFLIVMRVGGFCCRRLAVFLLLHERQTHKPEAEFPASIWSLTASSNIKLAEIIKNHIVVLMEFGAVCSEL